VKNRSKVWFKDYDAQKAALMEKRDRFEVRCRTLGTDADEVVKEIRRELISRAVYESNWQEGLRLDLGKTRALANFAFDELIESKSPHLDTKVIINRHRAAILKLRRAKASDEEVGAFNLASAHILIEAIEVERLVSWFANVTRAFGQTAATLEEILQDKSLSPEIHNEAREAMNLVWRVEYLGESANIPLDVPILGDIRTFGEYVEQKASHLFHIDASGLEIGYLNLLHRITMMGILEPIYCGKFRKVGVTVGDPETLFPVPSLVPGLMNEYCKHFPDPEQKIDYIQAAADFSYRLVAIHPYLDGNGRMSRLAMNLLLYYGGFLPVSLKADAKGRHRYLYSLKRAYRGDIGPLACLIARSLSEIYDRVLRSVS
jgi:prophage maintenance system killer protein